MNFFLATLACSFLALLVSSVPLGDERPDPSKVYIESIKYGGTGCPQGSIATTINDSRTTFTLIFDAYLASTGPNIPITESRKDCQINLNLHIPGGFTYTIGKIDYRGYVQLGAGATAASKSTYYFSGQSLQADCNTPFKGPLAKDYLISNEIPLASWVWCPCGVSTPVNIKNQILILPGFSGQANQITTDSIDGKVTHVYGVAWSRC